MLDPMVHLETTGCDFPQTRRGLERRLALLLSANTLFLEHGYDAVSLDDIVHHAGGSKASIYKYFGNKEGLFSAICDHRRQDFFQGICTAFDPTHDNLRAYLINTLINFHTKIKTEDNIAFMRMVIEQTQRSPKLAQSIHEKGAKRIQLAIAKALEIAHKNGVVKCENPIFSAQLYFGILRNLEWRILMNLPVEETEQETTNYITYCVDRFLDGHQNA